MNSAKVDAFGPFSESQLRGDSHFDMVRVIETMQELL